LSDGKQKRLPTIHYFEEIEEIKVEETDYAPIANEAEGDASASNEQWRLAVQEYFDGKPLKANGRPLSNAAQEAIRRHREQSACAWCYY